MKTDCGEKYLVELAGLVWEVLIKVCRVAFRSGIHQLLLGS